MSVCREPGIVGENIHGAYKNSLSEVVFTFQQLQNGIFLQAATSCQPYKQKQVYITYRSSHCFIYRDQVDTTWTPTQKPRVHHKT